MLTWNGLEHLEVCLSSLCAQTFRDREIILVDDASTDGTKAWVEGRFPEVRVARLEKNGGVPGGLNFGIAQARGRYIALLNNDIEAHPEWLAESIRALEQHPEAGFTATRIRLFYHRDRLDTTGDEYFLEGFPAKRGWLHQDGPDFDEPGWVFGSCCAAAVYRRELFDAVGNFDVDFQASLEDLDLSFRAQLQGFKCRYVPTAILYHKLGATLGMGFSKRGVQLRTHRNLWLLRIKNLPGALWLRYLPRMVVGEAVVMLRALATGRFGVMLHARLQVLPRLKATLTKRRDIQARRTISARELDAIIARGWFDTRRREKRLEAEVRLSQP
ncbi:MAG: glycosyltransferase family 2 protein [Vicinamibacterales bacterium]